MRLRTSRRSVGVKPSIQSNHREVDAVLVEGVRLGGGEGSLLVGREPGGERGPDRFVVAVGQRTRAVADDATVPNAGGENALGRANLDAATVDDDVELTRAHVRSVAPPWPAGARGRFALAAIDATLAGRMTEDHAPGWDAIDQALRAVYGDVEPRHYAAALPASLGGNDPLNGISVYQSEHGGRAHWHFVTYGYSELFEKETDDPEVSGFGFEMTIRVTDPEWQDDPPPWVLSLLQNLARYVFRTGNTFAPGHHSPLNGPIALGRETALVAAAFVADPELPAIETPHGSLAFVQLVGLTQDELDAVRAWDTLRFLDVVRAGNPAFVTELTRRSYLEAPAIRARVEEGTAREGSSMGALFMAKGSYERDGDRVVLGLAANALADVARAMRGRLAHGRDVLLHWPGGNLVLAPSHGATAPTTQDDDTVVLDDEDRAALAALPVQRGDYPLPSGLVIRVIPVEIHDGTRTRVERVIG